MPKRVGFLYEKMADKALIRMAILDGAKHKSDRYDVSRVLKKLDAYIDRTYDLIVSESYVPSVPRTKMRYDASSRKTRLIQVVPFWPDGVMHRLMVMVLQPVFMRGMYRWSCASIPGRGGSQAQKYVKRCIGADAKGTKYCCKLDVHRFYPSIDRKRLIWALARKVKDKRMLKLVYDVIMSSESGLAIGFYINQWLANFYLEPLDNFICTLTGVKYSVRYMDDIVLFGPNKKLLHKAHLAIAEFLRERLGLELKGDWQVFPLKARALDFVGYRFSRSHVILRKRTFLRFTRQCRRAQKRLKKGKPIHYKMAAGLLSRLGILKHCDSFSIRKKYLEPVGEKKLKEVVRNESKRRYSAAQRLYGGRQSEISRQGAHPIL
ncbi:MAG: RNA-directed DNA polymerase [Oscillospiraceae bacterium]|nr:RNA-directed DNA polymerase [Oscillospiraceae bacterium]